jgi:hypothetical protein
MPHARYRGPPMDLANMRAQGVRSLVCDLCHHDVVVNADAFDDDGAGASLLGPTAVHQSPDFSFSGA